MKFFNYDSPFWSFMSRVADLVILNLLWLLFCIFYTALVDSQRQCDPK